MIAVVGINAHKLRPLRNLELCFKAGHRLAHLSRKQFISRAGNHSFQLFAGIEPAFEPVEIRRGKQARLDQNLEVLRIRLQQKQIRQPCVRRKIADRLCGLFANRFDHALRVLSRRVRQIAVFRVCELTQRILQRTLGHAADGISAKERLFQRADARASIGVAWLWHETLPPLSRRAADRPRSLPRRERYPEANGTSSPSHSRRQAG